MADPIPTAPTVAAPVDPALAAPAAAPPPQSHLPDAESLFPKQPQTQLPNAEDLFPDEATERRYRSVNTGTERSSPVQDFLFRSDSPLQDFLFGSPVAKVTGQPNNFQRVGRILDAIGQGVKNEWGTDRLGLSPENEKQLRDLGIFNDYEKGQYSLGRAVNSAIIRPAVTAYDLAARATSAGFAGYQAGMAKTGEEYGFPKLARELAALPEAEMGSPGLFHPPHVADVERARDLGVVGEGEAGWKGTAAPKAEEPAGPFYNPSALHVTVEKPTPDIHSVARDIAPDTFREYDALTARRDTFRNWLEGNRDAVFTDVSGATAPINPAVKEKIARDIVETETRLRELAPAVQDAYAKAGEQLPAAAADGPQPAGVEVAPQPPAERIASAAVQTKDGQIFTGVNHGEAAAAAEKAGHPIGDLQSSDGFVTSMGRYVGRTEAFDLADQAKQIDETAKPVGRQLMAHQVFDENGKPLKQAYEPGLKGQGLVASDAIKKQWRADSPIKTVDDLFEHAKENQDRLASVAQGIAGELGIEFHNPGVKGRPRTQEKVDGGKVPAAINDVVRGGFVVDTPAQADAVLARLAQHFEVADEGWAVTPSGYFDRKVLVRFANGQGGEIQLWHPEMLRAKQRGGHRLYAEHRSLALDDPRRAELSNAQKELYGQALDVAGPEWKALFGSEGSEGNLASNAALESTRPSMPTSASLPRFQEPSDSIQASPGANMKGSPSTTPNVSSEAIVPSANVGGESQKFNIAEDVAGKLIAAGRPQDEAQAAGAIHQAYWENRADRFKGVRGTAEEMYRRETPDIRGEGAVETAPQAAPPAIPADAALPPQFRAAPIPGAIPNDIRTFAPDDLLVDANRFQFKSAGDEAGVTNALKGVKVWDKNKAGMVMVWEDKAGHVFIVDGHQRLALAKRIAADDPAQHPMLDARVIREAYGYTDKDAYVIASLRNIAEGTGTAIDAAKVLRADSDLGNTLPPNQPLVREARGLVALSDDAFAMIVNDVVPANYGAIVGRLVPGDPEMQSALIGLLAKTEPSNPVQAEAIARQGIEAGIAKREKGAQGSLFGDDDIASSLYLDRAKVLDKALSEIGKDKKIFSVLAKEQETIEASGNKLAAEVNRKRAAADAQTLQILQVLASRRGPVSELLGRAAERARADGKPGLAVRGFVAEIRGMAESGELLRLADGVERGPTHVGDEDAASVIENAPERSEPAAEREGAAEAGRVIEESNPANVAAEEAAQQTMFQRFRDLMREREEQGQMGLLGMERIGEGELAQRLANVALRPKVEQRPMEEGLFGEGAKQRELFQTTALAQTETPEFKRWFGDSKVVDEAGGPLVVYHGTKSPDFESFKRDKAGASDPGLVGKAFYFTPTAEQASDFATNRHYGRGENPAVIPAYVALKNPVEVVDGRLPDGRALSELHPQGITKQSSATIQRELRKAGYDGAIFKIGGEIVQVAAFEPTQIKSAIGNRGTFDQNDPRILFQRDLAPLFQQGDVKRGKIRLREAGPNVITLLKDANASTFLHETGHDWLDRMLRDAEGDDAPADLKADAKATLRYLGVGSVDEVKTRHHELFARAFENYLMEGRAPSKALAAVFAKFREWLLKIYHTAENLKAPLNDEIRGVFDRMLAINPERVTIAPDMETGGHAAAEAGERARAELERIVAEHREPPPEAPAASAPPVSPGEMPPPAPGEAAGAPEGEAAPAPVPKAATVATTPPAGPHEPFEPATTGLIDKAGNIRLDNLGQPEDVNRVLREAADRNQGFIDARRGVISDRQVLDLADALGMDAGELNKRQLGQAFNAEEIMAARKLLIQSATNVRDLAVKAAEGVDADVLAYAEAATRHRMIQEQVSGITAEAGRALRAFRSLAGMKLAQDIDVLMQEATGLTLFQMQRQARKVARLSTTQAVSVTVRQMARSGVFDWLQASHTMGLLSGLFTHAGYTVAAEMLAVFRGIPEVGGQVLVGRVRQGLTGLSGAERVHAVEMRDQLYGLYRGAREGIMASWDAWKSNEVKLPVEVTRLNSAQALAAGRPIATSHGTIPNPLVAGFEIPVGTVIESPGRLIAALHTFNWTTFYRQSIHGQASHLASREGLTGDDHAARVGKLAFQPTDAMIAEGIMDANAGALMQRPAYDSSMGKFSRWINHGIMLSDLPLPGGRSVPMGTLRPGKYIDPFVQVQATLMRTGLVHGTPLELFHGKTRDDLMMRNGAVAFDRTAGRILAGTTFIAAAMGLTAQSLLNPSGPSDPKQAAMWQRINGLPHGLRIGDTTYDMLRLGPLGMRMSVAADLWHAVDQMSEGDIAKVGGDLLHAFIENIKDESFMRGPAELMRAVDEWDRYGDQWARNFVSSFTPFSVGLSQMAREVDPYSRQARTTMDAVKAKIPWLSQELIPRRDVWGNPVENRGWLGTYNQAVDPDPVDQALYPLALYPGQPERKLRGVEMTDEQYDDYSMIHGRTAHMLLTAALPVLTNPNVSALTKLEAYHNAMDAATRWAEGAVQSGSFGTDDDIVKQAVDAKRAKLQPTMGPVR